MALPTLKELGLEDKRRRVPDEIKQKIKEELDSGITNMAHLSRKYKVSIGTVRMIKDPEHNKAIAKKSRDSKGGFRRYYNKDKQAKWMKALHDRKEEKIKSILAEYNKLKEHSNGTN